MPQPPKRDSTTIHMIDVSEKPQMDRMARASGEIVLKSTTIEKIKQGSVEKGNVIVASKLAGIAAGKKTADLLPLCHPLRLSKIEVQIAVKDDLVEVTAEVKATEKTGVEMEALVAISAALLNIWDMVKMYEKDADGQYPTTTIQNIHVIKKEKKLREAPLEA